MYKIIKAKPEHAKQIIPHLTTTCYWKEFFEGNLLNKSYEDFMLEWIVNPRILYTYVLVEEGKEDKVRGCIITGTTDEFATMPDYTPHLHAKAKEVFAPWLEFQVKPGVLVELFAVDEDLRGKGYGSKLYKIAQDLAANEGKNRISGFIWACFPNSIINATRKGRMVTGILKFPHPCMELPLLYLESTPEYAKFTDYFQSEEYLNTKNMLLG